MNPSYSRPTPIQNNYLSNHVRSNSGVGNLGLQSKNESQESTYGLQGNYSGVNPSKDRINQYKSNYQYQGEPNREEKVTSFKQINNNNSGLYNNNSNNYQFKGGYGQARAHF